MTDRKPPRRPARTSSGARKPRAPRTRRQPEEARRLILDAARAVIAERGPDAVGLKEVAERAGVSHGLVTHYFGTYRALVDETLRDHLERSTAKLAARAVEPSLGGPRAWVELAAEHVGDPVYAKLMTWGLLSGRLAADDSPIARFEGLRRVADLIESTLATEGRPTSRDRIEHGILLVMSSLIGYAVAREVLFRALGQSASEERDRRFRDALAQAVERVLEAEHD